MRHAPLGRILAVALTALAALACGDDAQERQRCPQCGMYVDVAPRWNAGVTGADGEPALFDSPKCLLRWLSSVEGRGASLEWVTEYYSQERRPAHDVWFVSGSDVTSPMGQDLVPVGSRSAAERFSEEHGGQRILRAAEVDEALLESLD